MFHLRLENVCLPVESSPSDLWRDAVRGYCKETQLLWFSSYDPKGGPLPQAPTASVRVWGGVACHGAGTRPSLTGVWGGQAPAAEPGQLPADETPSSPQQKSKFKMANASSLLWWLHFSLLLVYRIWICKKVLISGASWWASVEPPGV